MRCDVRGSEGQGRSWATARPGEGGELRDLEQVLSLLLGLSWVDPARLAVYGEGWGGHLAVSALLANTRHLNSLHCATLLAPITDWTLGKYKRIHHNFTLDKQEKV